LERSLGTLKHDEFTRTVDVTSQRMHQSCRIDTAAYMQMIW